MAVLFDFKNTSEYFMRILVRIPNAHLNFWSWTVNRTVDVYALFALVEEKMKGKVLYLLNLINSLLLIYRLLVEPCLLVKKAVYGKMWHLIFF